MSDKLTIERRWLVEACLERDKGDLVFLSGTLGEEKVLASPSPGRSESDDVQRF